MTIQSQYTVTVYSDSIQSQSQSVLNFTHTKANSHKIGSDRAKMVYHEDRGPLAVPESPVTRDPGRGWWGPKKA